MKSFAIFAALVAVVNLSGAAAAESGRDGYSKAVKSKQAEAPSKGLLALFTTIQSKTTSKKNPEPVSYTRAWLDKQPKPEGDSNWKCLSEALYFEARGETVKGQFAVAEVIMNRVKSSRFPDSPCAVIKQGTGKRYQCQFSYTCDGHKEVIAEPQAYERATKVARVIIDGMAENITNGAMFYHNTTVRPRWARTFQQTARIGVHIFYRPNYRTASND